MVEQSLVTKEKDISTVRDLFVKNKALISGAVSKYLDPDRLLKMALVSVQVNPRLAECHPATLLGAVIKCAQLGLEPDTAAQRAHLIPFKNTRKDRLEVQLIVGYRGLCHVVTRDPDGPVVRIEARVVHQRDKFDYSFGTTANIQHEPYRGPEKPGEPTHFYAIALFRDGSHQFDVMTKDEVDSIRRRSRTGAEGPWSTDYEEMGKKTVVRRLTKMLPVADEAHEAANLDERASLDLPQDLGVLSDPGEVGTPPGSIPEPIKEPLALPQPQESPIFQENKEKGEAFYLGPVTGWETRKTKSGNMEIVKTPSANFGVYAGAGCDVARDAHKYGTRIRATLQKSAKGNYFAVNIEKA